MFMFRCRVFRIMDDDGNKKLDYNEFQKGIFDYGLNLEPEVYVVCTCSICNTVCTILPGFQ